MTSDVEVSNVKLAMLLAAESIEREPALFKFTSVEVPSCGTPGCAVGWMAFYLREMEGEPGELRCVSWDRVSERMGMANEGAFYDRMNEATKSLGEWHTDASVCAAGLRRLAEEY